MVEKGFTLHHGILIIPEMREDACNKIIEFDQGLRAGYREMEGFERTKMIRKGCSDQGQNLFEDCRLRVPDAGWRDETLGRWFPVFLVVIPLPAGRRTILLNQDVIGLAHFTVEIFHTHLLLATGPAGEAVNRAQEAVVGPHLDRESKLCVPRFHHLADAIFTGFGDNHLTQAQIGCCAFDFPGEAACIVRICQRDIADL